MKNAQNIAGIWVRRQPVVKGMSPKVVRLAEAVLALKRENLDEAIDLLAGFEEDGDLSRQETSFLLNQIAA